MTFIVIGAGATKQGARDWSRTVEHTAADPMWGYDEGAVTAHGYIVQAGDIVLFHTGPRGSDRWNQFHMVARVTSVLHGNEGRVKSAALWPDAIRQDGMHNWQTVFAFKPIGQVNKPKNEVNDCLGYKPAYTWAGPQVLTDEQVADLMEARYL